MNTANSDLGERLRHAGAFNALLIGCTFSAVPSCIRRT
jgi:hypothetical protein